MITLAFEFLAGRFHATPWDRNVNEGDVEWPPSPWRLLRAIASGWFHAGGEDAEELGRLVEALSAPPRFVLPPWRASHTRHYMPQRGGSSDTALVLDAFVSFAEKGGDIATAFALYDVDLEPATRAVLERATASISYLGRAESWCRVRVLDYAPSFDEDRVHVAPSGRANDGFLRSPDGPVVRRLAAKPGQTRLNLLTSLLEATAEMRRAKRVLPLAAAWLDYQFEPHFGAAVLDYAALGNQALLPQRTERFVVEGGDSGLLRPSVYETVRVAEAMRSAAMSMFSKRNNQLAADPVLTGKAESGERSLSNHAHAYFLPRDLDDDGQIDHIDVCFPSGCSVPVHTATRSVRCIYWYGKDSRYDVTHLGEAPPTSGTRWTSSTPFVLPRFPKVRGGKVVGAPVEQLLSSLKDHGIEANATATIAPERIQMIPFRRGAARLRADMYRRSRSKLNAATEENRLPFLVATINFETPVGGPISVGRLAHFGLGQFRLADE